MKNTTKISLMSGLVTAGVLLCGVHIANAQTNIDSGYTITIPSEVGIDKDSGKGSFFIPSRQPLSTALKLHTMESNVLIELPPHFEHLRKRRERKRGNTS